MSEKWETVVTTSKKGAKSPKSIKGAANGKPLNKKKEAKVYTMEDVLPSKSVENMYASAFDPTPPSPKKKDSNGTAKPAAPKPKEKKIEKPKLPSSVGEAVKSMVRVEDLKNLVESSQARFPDSPLLWLRDVAAFLNIKLVTEPPAETDDFGVLGGLPSGALTANMKKVISVMLGKVQESMRETFFETCVANTAHDLAKGLCTTGWKILTQMLAEVSPSIVTAHIPRYIELRNSYQNRPAVGQAILWSVGQAGLKSLHSGIRVWLDVMLPVITMRHYSKYCVDYLSVLLQTHSITPSTLMNKPVMDIQNFITVQDAVFILSNQMNKDHARKLKEVYPSLRAIAVAGCKNHELFPALLARLPNINTPDQVVDTLDLLATCLSASPAALVHWHKSYISNLSESGQLLQYLNTNWSKFKSSLDVPEFHETIEAFSDYNMSVANKEGLDLATDGCNSLSTKFSVPGMAWFPWKTVSFLLLVFTAALVNLDVDRAGGNFAKSNTGHFLKDVGQYDRVMSGYGHLLAAKAWADTNVPLYLALVQERTGPLLTKASLMASEGLVKAREATQAGLSKLDELLPGGKEQVAQLWANLLKNIKLSGEKLQIFVNYLAEEVQNLYKSGIDWEALKLGAEELLVAGKQQALTAYNYIQLQINQLVK